MQGDTDYEIVPTDPLYMPYKAILFDYHALDLFDKYLDKP